VPPTRTLQAEADLAAFALAPSCSEIAGALKNGKTCVWSIAGKFLRSWTSSEWPPNALFYAGDRRIVAVTKGDVRVLDASSGQKLAGWEAHKLAIESVAATADFSRLATASDDGTVKLWNADGTPVRAFSGGLGEMLAVALTHTGRRIAAAGSDTDIRLFDVKSGALEHVLDLEMSCPAVAFSPDGKTLAAGSVDGTVTLWDADSGASHGTLARHACPVGAVSFSADGKHLASTALSMNPATVTADARVWDLHTGTEKVTPIGISAWNAVGFSPAGHAVVVGVERDTISVWDLSVSLSGPA
jgi:WD40 repeat protein